MYKRILVPLDDSPASEAILPHVQTLAGITGSEIVLLHVVPTPAPEFLPPSNPVAKGFVHDQRAEATRYLKGQCAKLEKGNVRATYLIREGDVPETILEVAKIMEADVIAMSTHGRSGARLLLLGSVTYQVVRNSPLPVLVIREKP